MIMYILTLQYSLQVYSYFTKAHALKTHPASLPVVMLPLVLYSDDTSGNKSKQWNKFDSWCLKFAGLPNVENQKLENIHHLCSSNKVAFFASYSVQSLYVCVCLYVCVHVHIICVCVCVKVDCIEMVQPIVEELKTLECDGVVAYDALLQKEVLVVTPILCFICDNPRASEITNNLGPGSRMFCRMCMVRITLGVHTCVTCHLVCLFLCNRWTGMLIQRASGSLDQSS